MPVDRNQYNSRGTTVDRHFMRRKLVEKRKEEWKVMLQSDDKKTEQVPTSIDYRANVKNNIKRQVVAATAQRLSDNSHAAIRAMRSDRLSVKNDRPTPEAKSQSAREMRLARLKQNTSTTSSTSSPPPTTPTIPHKKRVKATTIAIDSQAALTSSIREMRMAQGKAPVAKSYTSSTCVLRVPKTTASPNTAKAIRPCRPSAMTCGTKQSPIRTPNKPRNQTINQDDLRNNGGCSFIPKNDFVGGGCHGFMSSADSTTSDLSEEDIDGHYQFVKVDDVMGGCNASYMENLGIGCDLSMLQDLNSGIASFLGCAGENDKVDESNAELVSRGSSEEDSAMYVKNYGYEY
eukprot:CAMPEP_0202488050 /NCGR_PEP_ID=MMETSP1361-20130828/6194_1 /ASSEMBLY_ACC=CAM_ASM_000849 /TAXON_ID=210615 /ORGANISM="Staurosira complex sp., Strain CCMP2646" /LENGTH=345 /DNA_ID=CAMNT_0049117549 /DNA_START=67 /DNA_END=1104 /DNA_ORIENTATION=-